ncbi:hypothetical protein CR513_09654, partial [Mucuna pruriens]
MELDPTHNQGIMGSKTGRGIRKENPLCEGYPNVPLLGTQDAINYNPELTVRQAGYPMIMPPPDEVMTPFVLHGPEAHKGAHYQKI